MKTFQPDTCDCLVEEQYTTQPNGSVACDTVRVLRLCAAHSNVPPEQWDPVVRRNENWKRGKIEMAARELLSDATEINTDGALVWRAGREFRWRWEGQDAARVLYVQIVGHTLNVPQRNAINNWIAANYPGQIVLEG